MRETVLAATQTAGFSPLPLFEVGDPATVRFLVRERLGIGLVPASWLERPGPVVGAADLKDPPRHRLSGRRVRVIPEYESCFVHGQSCPMLRQSANR